MYQWAYLLNFDLNVLHYSEANDFLLMAFKNPMALIFSLVVIFLLFKTRRFLLKKHLILAALVFAIFAFPFGLGGLSGDFAKYYVMNGKPKSCWLFPSAGQPGFYTYSYANKKEGVDSGYYILSTAKFIIFSKAHEGFMKIDVILIQNFIKKSKWIDPSKKKKELKCRTGVKALLH